MDTGISDAIVKALEAAGFDVHTTGVFNTAKETGLVIEVQRGRYGCTMHLSESVPPVAPCPCGRMTVNDCAGECGFAPRLPYKNPLLTAEHDGSPRVTEMDAFIYRRWY